MPQPSTYNVVISNQIRDGFLLNQVIDDFSAIFSIPPERVAELLKDQWVIKKDVDLATAETYREKLEAIGLVVTLKGYVPPASDADGSLSLMPLDDKPASEDVADGQGGASNLNVVVCPKCHLEQPAGSDECTGCGVFMQKVQGQAGEADAEFVAPTAGRDEKSEPVVSEGLSGKSIGAGAAAALLGALIWYFIANVSGYELGLVAWGIGALIGFVVAAMGSRGQMAGVACAVLAVVAILAGKFMIYSSFQDEFTAAMDQSKEEVRYLYDGEMAAAKAYARVSDEESLRQFMVDHQFSEAYRAEGVSLQEIESFQSENKIRLTLYAYASPEFEDWYQTTFIANLPEISTLEIVKEGLSPIDLLFLFLGVATAFRLGRGETA